MLISAANTNDHVLLERPVDSVTPVRRPLGQPRTRPDKLHGDRGYDYRVCRAALRRRGITARIARKGIESSTRLGRHRHVIERALERITRSGGWPAATNAQPPTSTPSPDSPAPSSAIDALPAPASCSQTPNENRSWTKSASSCRQGIGYPMVAAAVATAWKSDPGSRAVTMSRVSGCPSRTDATAASSMSRL